MLSLYVLQHKAQRGSVVEGTDRAARLIFQVIMSAPDLSAERKPPRSLEMSSLPGRKTTWTDHFARIASSHPSRHARRIFKVDRGLREEVLLAKTRESPSGVVQVNGADIYHEIRAAGPTLLLIAPGGGDGGVSTELPMARSLANPDCR